MSSDPTIGQDGTVPAELSHAGAVVDKAIEYMLGQELPPLAIASALLGGSLALLARTMDEGAMLRMLDNASRSVRAGELRPAPQANGAPEVPEAQESGRGA
ncbi:hypothetical protein [Lichenicoccus sp.]|uniref:hypothetical protein n=1 Tax=Lichenicoccus sp. TaxID=2781899 RepID=UPI003D0C9290